MSHQPLRRVLIVDDEPAVREMLAVALEMAGFEVLEAENASTALNQVASSLPDLMLIDWMMPQVSGLELCRRLRRNPDTANILSFFSLRAEKKMRRSLVSKSQMTISPSLFHRVSSWLD